MSGQHNTATRIDPDRSFLLVIDVQEKLAPAVQQVEEVLDRITLLVKAALRLEIPVLATEHYPKGIGQTMLQLRSLLPADSILEKIHFSAASEPLCASRFSALGRPQVVVAGTEAHVCVMQSALGLHQAGYQVFVAADATSSRRMLDRTLAVDRMRASGLTIVTAEMVVFEWLQRGDTPQFRAVLPMIKPLRV